MEGELGLALVADAPGVGENLMDHLELCETPTPPAARARARGRSPDPNRRESERGIIVLPSLLLLTYKRLRYFQHECSAAAASLQPHVGAWWRKLLIGARWLLARDGLGATNHFEVENEACSLSLSLGDEA